MQGFHKARKSIGDEEKVGMIRLAVLVEIDIDDEISNCIVNLEVHEGRVYVHTSDDRIHVYEGVS